MFANIPWIWPLVCRRSRGGWRERYWKTRRNWCVCEEALALDRMYVREDRMPDIDRPEVEMLAVHMED